MKWVLVTLAFALVCVQTAPAGAAQHRPFAMPSVAPAPFQEAPQAVKPAIPPQAKPVQTPNPTASQERPQFIRSQFDADSANLKLEVVITYQAGSAAPIKRSAVLMVADQGRGSLRSGTQVAVPQTQYMPTPAANKADNTSAPAPMPMTSYQYRSVGLNVDASRVGIVGNKARLELSVEFSAIDEKSPEQPGRSSSPSFPTFSQNLTLVLENGKPLVIAQTSDVADNVVRKQSVEVTATILR